MIIAKIARTALPRLMLGWAMACAAEQSADTACEPGRSVSCVTEAGCHGAQVCAGDGSGFEACKCAPSYATGGASQTLAGTGGSVSQSTGGNATGGFGVTSGGTIGQTTTSPIAVGGVGGSSICEPSAMTGYAYPRYVAARRLQGSCTRQVIDSYYSDCIMNDNCDAYLPGGAQETCGACLNPSELGSSSYGPLLKVGNTWTYFYELNTAGCLELLGEVDCAPKIQVDFLCRYNSCAGNCRLSDAADFDPLMQCMSDAESRTCSNQKNAANCVVDPNDALLCSGGGFLSQYLAVAAVFCQ